MKVKRFLALLMSAATMITMFAACGKGEGENKETTAAAGENTTAAAEAETSAVDITKGFTATKIGTTSYSGTAVHTSIGVYYKDASGKYGIVSSDGKFNSGAKYTYCKLNDDYFEVSTTAAENIKTATDNNCYGLVDGNGKVVVPMEYYYFAKINDRYYEVAKITEKTTDKNEVLIYLSDRIVDNGAQDGDDMYKGIWYVYDVTTGKAVPGATGTKGYKNSAYGDVLIYTTDSGEYKRVGPDGKEIPDAATVLENGYYVIQGENVISVYDVTGTKLFELSKEDCSLIKGIDENKFAVYNDDKVVFIDKAGKKISAEFEEYSLVEGELLIADGKVYDLDGKLILDGNYHSIKKDSVTKNVWLVSGSEGTVLLQKDGTVLYKSSKGDGSYIKTVGADYLIENESSKKYYSFKEKDFTIKGSAFAPWLVTVTADDYSSQSVVDTLSGKTIVDGYKNCYCVVDNGTIYIHATNQDGNVDVFKVS